MPHGHASTLYFSIAGRHRKSMLDGVDDHSDLLMAFSLGLWKSTIRHSPAALPRLRQPVVFRVVHGGFAFSNRHGIGQCGGLGIGSRWADANVVFSHMASQKRTELGTTFVAVGRRPDMAADMEKG